MLVTHGICFFSCIPMLVGTLDWKSNATFLDTLQCNNAASGGDKSRSLSPRQDWKKVSAVRLPLDDVTKCLEWKDKARWWINHGQGLHLNKPTALSGISPAVEPRNRAGNRCHWIIKLTRGQIPVTMSRSLSRASPVSNQKVCVAGYFVGSGACVWFSCHHLRYFVGSGACVWFSCHHLKLFKMLYNLPCNKPSKDSFLFICKIIIMF